MNQMVPQIRVATFKAETSSRYKQKRFAKNVGFPHFVLY